MIKKFIFFAFLVLFLAGAVSAENSTDILGDAHAEPVYVADDYDSEVLSSSSEDYDTLEISEDYDANNRLGDSPCQPPPVVVPDEDIPDPWIIVNKYWEGNDSGNITYVEVELLLLDQQKCPPKWKSSPDDLLNDDEGRSIPITINGTTYNYTVVGVANITKDNNWKYVFKNLSDCYSFAYLNRDTMEWILSNPNGYLLREVNVPENVMFLNASYVSYKTCPVDGGLKIFWNLTNKFIPSNDTNETENFTEETPINYTVENKTIEEIPKNDEIVNITSNRTEETLIETNQTFESTPEKVENKKIDVKNATGNPLAIILIVIAVLGIVVFRRKF